MPAEGEHHRRPRRRAFSGVSVPSSLAASTHSGGPRRWCRTLGTDALREAAHEGPRERVDLRGRSGLGVLGALRVGLEWVGLRSGIGPRSLDEKR
jgi:hypothetical protein